MRALDLISDISELLGWGVVTTLAGEPSTNTRKVIRGTNLVLNSMQAEKNWPELEAQGTLVTQEDLSIEILCGVLKGSDKFVVADLDTNNLVGCLLKVSGFNTIYRIIGAGPTELTLDRIWVEDTITADTRELVIGRDQYEVPVDYDRMKSDELTNMTNAGHDVDIVEEEFLGVISGSTLEPDSPERVYIGGEGPSGRQMMQFDQVPDNIEIYRYKYQINHPPLAYDDQLLKYPTRYHMAIIDTVVARLETGVDNKDKGGAQKAMEEKIRQGANPSTSESRMRFRPKGRRRARRRY